MDILERWSIPMDIYQATSLVVIVLAVLAWKVFRRWSELEELKIRSGRKALYQKED